MVLFYDLPRVQLEDLLRPLTDSAPVHAAEIFRRVYRLDGAVNSIPREAGRLPSRVMDWMDAHLCLALPTIHEAVESRYDLSVKFRMRMHDGLDVESVLMPERRRITLCVSSQGGCAQACAFCHTGRMGLKRNLSAGEIVGQVLAASAWMYSNPDWIARWRNQGGVFLGQAPKVTNVVFMGMGEPLDNVDATLDAIAILSDPLAVGIGLRRISVSTAGHGEGLKRLLARWPQVPLALSLHAVDATVRRKIMPIERRWPVRSILDQILAVPEQRKRGLLVQYTLLSGINDREADARALADFLEGVPAKVNLIPFNAFEVSSFSGPSVDQVAVFRGILYRRGIRTMVRYSKGQDIGGACGQLVTQGHTPRGHSSSAAQVPQLSSDAPWVG